MSTTKTTTTTTVGFNVGGTIFEVSKSLIDKYPGTLLSTLVSKRWAKEDGSEGGSDPIFIERDSARFCYVLDYMRNGGKVFLPEMVSIGIPRRARFLWV